VNQAAARLLKPEALSRFSSLELLARTVVDGALTGLHRSPHFGFSQEFAEYRAYNEGDDLRYVDWNVYARTDRTYIKRFRGDTNTSLMIVLDASASMGFGSAEVTKFDYARFLAATLAWLARKQHDAVGTLVFSDRVVELLEPSSRPDALPRLVGLLENLQCQDGTEVDDALSTLNNVTTRRGLVVIISDFYTDPETLLSAVQPLSISGKDIAIFHIVDPEEKSPVHDSVVSMRDLETGDQTHVDPRFMQGKYRERFKQHQQELEDLSRKVGADYVAVDTSEPLDDLVHRYLLFRQRKL